MWIPNDVKFRNPYKAEILPEDMRLPPDEFFGLFKSPKIDDDLRIFLQKIGVVIRE
jgi:hypothetical protein